MDFDTAMRASGGDAVAAAAMVFAEAPGDKRGADETFGDTNPADRQSMRGYETDELSEGSGDDEPEPLPEGLADQTLVPGVIANVLMHLDPTELRRVCATNAVFRAVCEDKQFRLMYRREWYIHVLLTFSGGLDGVWGLKTDILYDVLRRSNRVPPVGEYDAVFKGQRVTTHSSLEGMRAYLKKAYGEEAGAIHVSIVKAGEKPYADGPTYHYPGERRAGTRFKFTIF